MAGLLLHNVDHIVDGKAVRLHPNRINDRNGADAPGHLDQRLADVGMPELNSFCPQSACKLKAKGVMVATDHSFRDHEQSALNGKTTNRDTARYKSKERREGKE